jgi:hypothetical protein
MYLNSYPVTTDTQGMAVVGFIIIVLLGVFVVACVSALKAADKHNKNGGWQWPLSIRSKSRKKSK